MMNAKPYRKLITVALASSIASLGLTGCAEEQRVVKKETTQYSTFSGLRDYGNQNGYEVLTPVKLRQCISLQESFAAQKGALKDLQQSIDVERQAIEEQNAQLQQDKADLEKYQKPGLGERQNYEEYTAALQAFNDKISALRLKVQGYNNMQASYREKTAGYNQSVNDFNQSCAIDKKLYPQDLNTVATSAQ